MVSLSQQFGQRIKEIRKAARLTQEKFAEKAGLSPEYISRIERGIAQPSFKTLETMADVLNIYVKDFWDFKSPVLFKNKKQEASQKKEYVDAISSELEGMEARELLAVYNVVKGLAGR